MMRSVSISLPRTTRARPATRVILDSLLMELCQIFSYVDNLAAERRGCHHRRAHQECAAARASLPADEVPVRRRRAHFASLEAVGIHREAHRAARRAPLEACGSENFIQAFFFRELFDLRGSGHDQRANAGSDLLSL